MRDGVEMAMSDWNARVSDSFHGFMARVAKLGELTEVGSRFLRGFQQELEFFRRPPLHKTSKVIERIIEANKTDRMMAYVEAGCRLTHNAVQNAERLFSCQQELHVHIKKVKLLIDELEGASEKAIGVMQEANENSVPLLNTLINDALETPRISSEQEGIRKDDFSFGEAEFVHDHLEGILQLTIMTRIIYNMLKLEYATQEKIVLSLNLNSSSEELESYCMLWELRPYVDDQIIQQSWALVK